MPKKPPKHGKRWTQGNVNQLHKLASKKVSTKRIADKLGRSASAVRSKASKIGVRLVYVVAKSASKIGDRSGYVPPKPPVKSTRKAKGNK